MVKIQKLVVAVAATITLSTPSVFALSLGKITWQSSYGQPLNARIELSDAKGLTAQAIKTALASPAAFSSAGMDRPAMLSKLIFTPVINSNGTGYIQVTSSQSITEPFLDFLVDVSWGSNKMSKGYTILMDIPGTAPSKTQVKPKSEPVAKSEPSVKPARNEAKPKPQEPAANTPANTADSYTITRGDTLWSVAEKHRGSALANQAAAAIYRKNPKAFIGGNANQILAGYKLQLPSQTEIKAISVADSVAFINSTKGIKTAAVVNQKNPATTTQTKQPQADNAVTIAEAKKLQEKIENSAKRLSTAQEENDELSDELNRIEQEIARLERIAKEKEEQVKDITGQLSSDASSAATVDTAPDVVDPMDTTPGVVDPVDTTPDVIDPVDTTPDVTDPVDTTPDVVDPVDTTPDVADPVDTTPDVVDPVDTTPDVVDPVDTTPDVADPVDTTPPAEKYVYIPDPEPIPEESLIDKIIGTITNNIMYIGIGGIVALLLGVLVMRRRNAGSDSEEIQELDLSHISLDDDDEDDTPAQTPNQPAAPQANVNSPLSNLPSEIGIIDKVDIYLAYNRFDEAKELLNTALVNEPANSEYRLKLMEVFAEQGDKSSFSTQEKELSIMDPGSYQKIDALREKYAALFTASVANNIPDISHSNFDEDFAAPKAANPKPTTEELGKENHIANIGGDAPVEDGFVFDFGKDITPELDLPDSFFDEIEEEAQVKNERNTYTDDDNIKIDTDFQLDTIATNVPTHTPIFGSGFADSDLDESRESATEGFAHEEEPVIEEPKEEDFKFDLASTEPKSDLGWLEDSNEDTSFFNTESTADSVLPFSDNIESTDTDDLVIDKDQIATKFELVDAYITMEDLEGAHDLLSEIIREGSSEQKAQAQKLLSTLNIADTSRADFSDAPVATESYVLDEIPFTSEPVIEEPVLEAPLMVTETPASSSDFNDLGFELPPGDEVATKLTLAQAYISMGDHASAKDILAEIINEGTEEQKDLAQKLLNDIS